MELGSTVLNYSITGCKQVLHPIYIPPICQGKDEAMDPLGRPISACGTCDLRTSHDGSLLPVAGSIQRKGA
jgi:hypothetical protein